MKVAINRCYGGFGLSNKAVIEMFKRKNNVDTVYFYEPIREENELFGPILSFVKKNKENVLNASSPFSRESIYMSTVNYGDEIEHTEELEESMIFLGSFVYASDRSDKDLIAVIKELGKDAGARYSSLAIIEIPDDVDYEIDDYDGLETIHEKHRTWC